MAYDRSRVRSRRNSVVTGVAAAILAVGVCAPLSLARPAAQAGSGPLVTAGVGSASIDGQMGNGEWTSATVLPFTSVTGQVAQVTFYVMNDASNLYVAARVAPGTAGASAQFGVWFDTGDRGNSNEDGVSIQTNPFGFTDEYRCGPTRGWCFDDHSDGGGSVGAGGTFFEISHQLSSGDPQDFSLSAPSQSQIGFVAFVQVRDSSGSQVGEACLPSCDLGTGEIAAWGQLKLAAPPSQPTPAPRNKPVPKNAAPKKKPKRAPHRPAPPAYGVIKRAFAEDKYDRIRARFAKKTIEVHVVFEFASLPKPGLPIRVKWIEPNKTVHSLRRPRANRVETVAANQPLAEGQWRCVLYVGAKAIRTVAFRIG